MLKSFEEFYQTLVYLRGPRGCAWDRKQTADSLKLSLLEEAYECIEAINNADDENLQEELGDLLLCIFMIIIIKSEGKSFSVDQVFNSTTEKLIRRHPHVFADSKKKSVQEILSQWDEIKEKVEKKSINKKILDTVPRALPPLIKAYKLQSRAAKFGFDWEKLQPIWEKLDEEIGETKEALLTANQDKITEELGDMFFTLVNLSRALKVHPYLALEKANDKFKQRFDELETRVLAKGIGWENVTLAELDEIWEQIKKATEY